MTRAPRQPAAEPPRLRVDEVGEVLLVSTGGAHPATAAVARSLPSEVGRLGVVMADATLVYHPDLAYRLRRWVPLRHEAVRLIAPCAAVADTSGRIPAQVLAELLEADVIAPDGELAAVPGGTLYATVADGVGGGAVGTGQWLRYRPGRPPLPAGRRFPAPEWERDLMDFADPGIPEVTVEQIPAGLWIRWSRSAAGRPEPDDLAFAVPVASDSVALLVSRPGNPPLRAGDLRRLIEALPAALLDRLVVTPYGDSPVADVELGAVVSAAANRTLRVRTGLLLHLAGRGREVVTVGVDGMPTWAPFAREVAWRPHGGGRILSWTAPADQLLSAGPAQLMLNERWLVEIVEAGLWIREVGRSEGASAVRRLPLQAEHCTVVIGVGVDDQALPPWRSVDRLLRRLPSAALSRLRLAVQAAAGEWFAEVTAKGLRRILDGAPPLLLAADGRLRDTGTQAARPAPQAAEATVENAVVAEAESVAVRRGKAPVDDMSRLLRFVDQIRRTPAWDEEPVDDRPRDAEPQPAALRGGTTQPTGEERRNEPPPKASPVPTTAAPAGSMPVPRPMPASAPLPAAASTPVVVPAPVAVAPLDRDAGPEPASRPAQRAVSSVEGDALGQPDEEA